MRYFIAAFVLVASIGCKFYNAYDYVVPGSMAQRKKDKAQYDQALVRLNKNERKLVAQYVNNEELVEIGSGRPGKDETIAQILKTEKPIYSQQVADLSKPSVGDQIRKLISFQIANKQSIMSGAQNPAPGDNDQFMITLTIKNTSQKTISEVKGSIEVWEGMDTLLAFDIDQKGTLPVGQIGHYQTLQDLPRSAKDLKLFSATVNDLHLQFVPDLLVFSDGQVMNARSN